MRHACCVLFLMLLSSSALTATPGFFQFSMDQDRLTGVVDFSDLSNGPIRDHDRLVVCGARLCRAGDPADSSARQPVRLFGASFAQDSVFPSDQEADKLVARLKRLGINLVRLHRFDMVTESSPAQAQSILLAAPFPTLNPVAVQRMKRFLVKLRDAGIYVDLNIHVDYTFRPGIDNVPFAFPGDPAIPEQSKPLYIFDQSMVALQLKYIRALLSALGDDAKNVIAIAEISNEDSMLYEWASDQLEKNVRGKYHDELTRLWTDYQRTSCNPSADAGTTIPARRSIVDDKTRQCVISFLTDLDRTYLDRMRTEIKALLPEVIVTGTQMAYGGFQNMQSHVSMDMMDSHFYVDQYGFLGKFADWNTWYIGDVSQFDDGMAALRNVALYRPVGKPYMIGEYNQPWPNRQSAEVIPLTVALGSLQDWSALVFYSYSQTREDWNAHTPREFALDTDLAKLPTVGPMAWIYRTFEIPVATAALNIPITDATSVAALDAGVTDDSAAFLSRTLDVDTDSVFVKQVGVTREAADKHARAADPHEKNLHASGVTFDVRDGHMLIDTRSAAGFIGRAKPGQQNDFGRFGIRLANTARGYVTFIALSRDGAPLERSHRALWVLPGYAMGSRPGPSGPVPEMLEPVKTDLSRRVIDLVKNHRLPNRVKFQRPPRQYGYGVLAPPPPAWMERVECVVSMRVESSAVTVYPLDGAGRRLAPLSASDAKIRDGILTVHLQADGQALSPWYELVFD
jgi:hypothetical protein